MASEVRHDDDAVGRAGLRAGTPSAVGSLPHDDAGEAAALALRLQPEFPAAPSLPQRNPAEGMVAQMAAGMGGVTVDGDGRLVVEPRGLAPADDGSPLDPEAWAGTLAFLTAAAEAGHAGPVKLQGTGPVTLGLALVAAGSAQRQAFAAASATVQGRLRALVAEAGRRLHGNPLVVVLDEPGLVPGALASSTLRPHQTVDLLCGALGVLGPTVMSGIHCCGAADWSLVLRSGPSLLSLPVGACGPDDAAALAGFLEDGGWIAWGAVPTDRPLGSEPGPHWRRLRERWADLTANGCDPGLLRRRALVTPACGLANHTRPQVEVVYGLVRRIGERVHQEALVAASSGA